MMAHYFVVMRGQINLDERTPHLAIINITITVLTSLRFSNSGGRYFISWR